MYLANVFIYNNQTDSIREESYAGKSPAEVITSLAKMQIEFDKKNSGDVIQLRSLNDLTGSVSPTTLQRIGVRILNAKTYETEVNREPTLNIQPISGFSLSKQYRIGEISPDFATKENPIDPTETVENQGI